VNGQNVVGMKDKDIAKLIDDGGPTLTVTVTPSYLFQHMIEK
jgi:syntenin-1